MGLLGTSGGTAGDCWGLVVGLMGTSGGTAGD